MRHLLRNRVIVILVGLTAILALTVFTSGLDGLIFKPGYSITFSGDTGENTIKVGDTEFPIEILFFYFMIFLIIVLIVIVIVLPQKDRRIFLLVSALISVLLVLMLRGMESIEIPDPLEAPAESAGTAVEPMILEETPLLMEFEPPKIPSWVSYVVALVVTLAAALAAWIVILRRRRKPSLLEQIAQAAVNDLQAGRDWAMTVEDTYLRMVATVHEERNLKRSTDITPAEFALILERTGLPAESVRRLTTLFERVRYGGKRSTKADIEEAVACFGDIAKACRGMVHEN